MEWNKHIIRYFVVMLIQVLILNPLQFFGVCHPFIFILFLIMMPVTLPRQVELLLASVIGLIMDLFCNSLGVHMAACVLITYLRRTIISNLVMDVERLNGEINSSSVGKMGFIKYTSVLIIIYHTMVVMLSAWSFAHIGFNVLQILVSSLFSGLMIIGYEFLRSK